MKCFLLTVMALASTALMGKQNGGVRSLVRLSEPYELANIILALTPYGKSDPWEVAKNSAYYREVREHFDDFADHPLLQKVNYSREMWEFYLSFRTDAYAFDFDDQGRLERTFSFFANKGFQPFDDNLELIQDFVITTGFREFYRRNLDYYQQLCADYLESQFFDDMHAFLRREFPAQPEGHYAIVLSPLVGRMNCHRVINGVNTDFVTVPGFLLSGIKRPAAEAEIVSGLHMLFTELDHGFVNPVTEKNKTLVHKNFPVQRWDQKSGYQGGEAVFNEYMTWAVYDLFVKERFPAVAQTVSADWALQNETRGFIASSLFNRILMDVYDNRKEGQTISDLYPRFLRRLGKIEGRVRVPAVEWCETRNLTGESSTVDVVVQFSEPMQKLRVLDIVLMTGYGSEQSAKRIEIGSESIQWRRNGSELHIRVGLENGQENMIRFNSPWTTRTVLKSKRGVDLAPYTTVVTRMAE